MSESFFKPKNGGWVNLPAFEQKMWVLFLKVFFSFVSFLYHTFLWGRACLQSEWSVTSKKVYAMENKRYLEARDIGFTFKTFLSPPWISLEFPFPIIHALIHHLLLFCFPSKKQRRRLCSSRLKFPWGFWIMSFKAVVFVFLVHLYGSNLQYSLR